MKTRILALPAAVAALLLAAGSAAAVWPPGTVTVDTDGCSYTIHIDLDGQPAIIGWEVRVYAAVPLDGELVASGSGAPDAEGRLTVGPLEAAPGHYNAIIDDETPVDASAQSVDFTLSCETTLPSSPPTPTPTGSELPVVGTPTPPPSSGGELPVVATPRTGGVAGLTPPPTDTTTVATADAAGGGSLVVAGLAGLIAAALAFARTRRGPALAQQRVRVRDHAHRARD